MAENPYPDGLPIAPDTPMPPRRYIRWGGLPSAPSEDRNDEHRNAAWERGFVEGHAAAVAEIVKLLRDDNLASNWFGGKAILVGGSKRGWTNEKREAYLLGMYEAADLIESRYPEGTSGSPASAPRCDCRPGMDGSGVHHQLDCATTK